jgi:hypothetical protein
MSASVTLILRFEHSIFMLGAIFNTLKALPDFSTRTK